MNEGVRDAFFKIRDACHAGDISIDLTFLVRRDDEPRNKSIKGNTLKMLIAIGELDEKAANLLLILLEKNHGTK